MYKTIYLDNAAATYIDKNVILKISKCFKELYKNPSSIYRSAQKCRGVIDEGRKTVADILNCKPEEIYFTSGGTEANNWVIFGVVGVYKNKGKNIITTIIEHESLLNPTKELKKNGFDVNFLPVDGFGHIKIKDIERYLNSDTVLVSVMYANNEIGTIENIAEIGRFLKKKNIPFHTDACQAAGYLSLNVKELNVDLMTINSSKIYGPKGVGALYINNKIKIKPLMFGGGQERNMRPGTENIVAIAGFAEAIKITEKMREKESARLVKLRDDFIKLLYKKIPDIILNGDPNKRLPNNINISIRGVDRESLLLRLDMEGIEASSGSACTSGSLEPSHVLLGIGLSGEMAKSSLRMTLGRKTTWQELKKTTIILEKIVRELRS